MRQIQSNAYNVIRRVVGILLFGVVTGVVGSVLAIGFVEAIEAIASFAKQQSMASRFGLDPLILFTPVIGGLIVGILLYQVGGKRAQSLTELVFAAQTRETVLPLKDGIVNALTAIIGMGSGASVGLYGPLAVMGANVGNAIAKWTRTDATLAIGCGVAAAIATAFSAPIAALVFVHEVILRHYSMRAFAPITVASSTGFFISNYLLDRPLLFEVVAERSVFAPELLAFVVIGVVGAGVAIVFMKAVIGATAMAINSGLPLWLRPVVAGLGIGLMGQWIPQAMGPGLPVFTAAITDGYFTPISLWLILIAKILATALCLGFGFTGGVFSPSLLIGMLYGVLLGHGAHFLFGEAASGLAFYGLCGMAAVASSVIGGPLTAILIVFELTHNYELTTAVMVSVVFSNVVAYRLFGRSLFDRQLADQGHDLSTGRGDVILQRTPISSYVTTAAVVLDHHQSLQQALTAMIKARRQECYVVDVASKYIGKLRLFDILKLERKLRAAKDADAAPVLVHELSALHASVDAMQLQPEQSVWAALKQIKDFVGESIAVVDQRGYFMGVIYQSALVAAYLQLAASLRAEEHATS